MVLRGGEISTNPFAQTRGWETGLRTGTAVGAVALWGGDGTVPRSELHRILSVAA
jgi:hypothetical protein